jgi:hypothetical protein
MDYNNVNKINHLYKLIRTYWNIVLLGFELCFNLILVDKDLGGHSFVRIFDFFFQFCFGRNNRTFKWRKKKKAK